jgi:hypothetical protein
MGAGSRVGSISLVTSIVLLLWLTVPAESACIDDVLEKVAGDCCLLAAAFGGHDLRSAR